MEPFLIILFSDDRQPLESWIKRVELGKLESYLHDLLESRRNAGGIVAASIDLTMERQMTTHIEAEVWLPWVR
jgi:hypothetical protein